MTVARTVGLQPRFVGARRERSRRRDEVWEGFPVELIGPSFPLVNGRRPGLYVGSVVVFWLALLAYLMRARPAVVHVSDFELYWPARWYSLVARVPLIYNIHDNLSQRYRVWRLVAKALNIIEGAAAITATVTVVPEGFRRAALPSWARSKVVVVRNAPIDPGSCPPECRDGATVILFVGGWIDAGRGMETLAELVERNDGLRLRVAGMGDPQMISALEAHPRIDVLGYLPQSEVIRETAGADFVCALYDPIRPINRFAASNKIAESLAVGRPLVINRELEIAKVLAPYRCTVEVDYGDPADLAERLRKLRTARQEYQAMCSRARRAYEDHYAWESVRADILGVYRVTGFGNAPTGGRHGGKREGPGSATKGMGRGRR